MKTQWIALLQYDTKSEWALYGPFSTRKIAENFATNLKKRENWYSWQVSELIGV